MNSSSRLGPLKASLLKFGIKLNHNQTSGVSDSQLALNSLGFPHSLRAQHAGCGAKSRVRGGSNANWKQDCQKRYLECPAPRAGSASAWSFEVYILAHSAYFVLWIPFSEMAWRANDLALTKCEATFLRNVGVPEVMPGARSPTFLVGPSTARKGFKRQTSLPKPPTATKPASVPGPQWYM